ncbi:TlyA family RNA methyltransferase [Pseudoramibacter sp.]|jgi:23S rRNA (cytidine1920-2'-O)/16S rRNA (cytidine1409-2'-O)-methyltransferase|uniref:TlyA family RNA methyltransferase n=1 Tax=Pseudoramibacter sp. TaxID=2034862 RepID=UPI0025F4F7D1|nr:TlyA family RNA methyltransferase [Pseudoramibacter sp.]MCH4071452.1 TlyA family RNA methyltransferase [Pseudoramibacter sp.]MCH4105220.1 TlyA family RNA methyltransferase [Pseudoramibacter sp.]
MAKKKERLDKKLVELGLFDSREKAKQSIMAGLVAVDGVVHTKAGDQVSAELKPEQVAIKGEGLPFVSRGGFKLDKGIKVFDFPVKGRWFLDIGASTGGFTDVLLQNGAGHVTAIDVGYGQFDWKLRNDDRVTCMERTNFRKVEPEDIGGVADGSVMDVSFISILKLMPAIYRCVKEGALGIWLIKPQFEAGKENVGKNGVVRDPEIHKQVLCRTTQGIEAQGFSVLGLSFSPIRGPKGNIEFLCFSKKESGPDAVNHQEAVSGEARISSLVAEAHQFFKDAKGKDKKA